MPANKFKSILKQASRAAVLDAVIKLRRHVVRHEWLGPGNIYSRNYKNRNYKKVQSRDVLTRHALKKRQLKDYIAASIFTHCADGWSLLGRALTAATKGDSAAAVHFAYYAELRAAMSLLASEGIGVFNQCHVILTDRTIEFTPAKGTHQFTWLALEHWADRKLSSQILAEIIAPGSIPLSEWFQSFGLTTNLHPIGQSWLRSWGIDIKQFDEDRVLRNHSSYRPSRIVPRVSIPAAESVEFLKELWHLCEPNPTSRFSEIDRHLLRASLAKGYFATYANDPHQPANTPAYRTWVELKIDALGFQPLLKTAWCDFLCWGTDPSPSRLIDLAGKIGDVDDPRHHIQVISRAALLLRIAIGLNAKLLKDAAYTKADLEFWWRPYITDHGIISNSDPMSDFLDLWDDAEVALQEISDWEATAPSPYGYFDVASGICGEVLKLGECERVALWGLNI